MRTKLAAVVLAALAAVTLSAGVASAAPAVDRNSGAAEHSDCRTVASSSSRWVIEVPRTRIIDEVTGETKTTWSTKYVRELPEEGTVYRIVRDPRTVDQKMCQYR